jgi:adenosylcobinamide kinase/adenosylcobinamide-phosphate guanylyltransferase
MSQLTLILGGARSGKSSHALKQAHAAGTSVLFVATAEARDDEMKSRIAKHQTERPTHWKTLEAPTRVGEAIAQQFNKGEYFECVVIDCLTLLACNMFSFSDADVNKIIDEDQASSRLTNEIHAIVQTYRSYATSNAELKTHWIIISNEVGLGIIPEYPLGRIYRDILGRANQQLAAEADDVIFMVAGLPIKVK